MEWKDYRQSDNIEDRRDEADAGGGGFTGGGPSIGSPIGLLGRPSLGTIVLFVLFVIVLKLLGFDIGAFLQNGTLQRSATSSYTSGQNHTSNPTSRNDETTQFVRAVLAQTEDVWTGIFQAHGANYTRPKLVLYSGRTQSACGTASAATGPFYCPGDRLVYLDTAFFQEMQDRFRAGGDFAQGYVIAHEVGHHVQNLTGILPKYDKARQQMSEVAANKASVRVELQADCFAGIWGRFVKDKNLIDTGDLEQALNAAHQIGDDALQKQAGGTVVPDSFTHGTSAQRMKWFKRGFDTGDMAQCDTFTGEP